MHRSDRSATPGGESPRGLASRMLLAAVLATTAALLATACGGGSSSSDGEDSLPGTGKPAVTLGTKDFPEEFILGELYKQALEAQGYTVKLKKNIGSTEIIDKQLQAGEIDGYPEYLGVSVATTFHKDLVPKSAGQTYNLAKKLYEERGEVISKQTPFFDVD